MSPILTRPSWLLLTLWLFIWSWSASGSRGKASLSAAAQDVPDISTCALDCASVSSPQVTTCQDFNITCFCESRSFNSIFRNCLQGNCTSSEQSGGINFFNTFCQSVLNLVPPTNASSSPAAATNSSLSTTAVQTTSSFPSSSQPTTPSGSSQTAGVGPGMRLSAWLAVASAGFTVTSLLL